MTKTEFAKEMTWFTEFYEKQLNKIQTDIWFEIFKDEDISDFRKAIKAHLANDIDTRFPAPGKITAALTITNRAERQLI